MTRSFFAIRRQDRESNQGQSVLRRRSIGTLVSAMFGSAALFGLPAAPASAQLVTPTADPGNISYSCTFAVSAYACNMFEESAVTPGRSTVVTPGADGSTSLRLHTEPGDNNVFGSNANERDDVSITQAMTNCYEGQTMWYAHSMLFPSDFVLPNNWLVVFDFHNSSPGPGQANLEIDVGSNGNMQFSGYGGVVPYPTWRSPDYTAPIGTLQLNTWYNFVYNAKWSSNTDGFMKVWLNGNLILSYNGPTIYSGQGCYLKLANYHTPNGLPESVIFDRVVVGNTAASVTSMALQGVSGTGSTTTPPTTANAPSVPTSLAGTAVSPTQINLSWNASTGGATGYYVYLNNAMLAQTTGTTFHHTGLTPGATYNYRVSSFDAAGDNSAWTATPVAVTTPTAAAAADTQAPTVPTGLSGRAASSTQINLSWSPSTDNVGVTGYYVYANNAIVGKVTGTTFQQTGLTPNTTYNYRVSAFDAAGNNSAWTATPVAVKTTQGHVPGDYNGDGMTDILWRNSSTGADMMWLMNGATATNNGTFSTVADANWTIAGRADFDGDGKSDILWHHAVTGDNVLWLMNGSTVTSTLTLPKMPDTNWKIAAVADFNGDGKADILWRNTSTGDVAVWLMNGGTQIGGGTFANVPTATWTIAGVGDFDGDGKADILWRSPTTGDNIMWFMNGASIASSGSATSAPDLNWKVVGVGDFDGDGKADILWRNSSTGQDCLWLQNGATTLSNTMLSTVADQNWTVAQVGDFNGDGKADILWRNVSTGQNSIWFMNGATMSSSPYITSQTGNTWTISGH
jgi:chitodextrinase